MKIVPECRAAFPRFQMTATGQKDSGTALFHITQLRTPLDCPDRVNRSLSLTQVNQVAIRFPRQRLKWTKHFDRSRGTHQRPVPGKHLFLFARNDPDRFFCIRSLNMRQTYTSEIKMRFIMTTDTIVSNLIDLAVEDRFSDDCFDSLEGLLPCSLSDWSLLRSNVIDE